MGYSKSKKAVRAVSRYLDSMLQSDTDISFPARSPQKLAYSIHNGIYASTYHVDTKKYSILKNKFAIILKPNVVKCEIKDALSVLKQDMADTIVLEDIVEPIGVIGAAIKHKANIMNFPDFIGSIEPIKMWCDSNGYNVQETDNGISLIREGIE